MNESVILAKKYDVDTGRVFKRKIYDRLLKWKDTNNGKSPLWVQGCTSYRQIHHLLPPTLP